MLIFQLPAVTVPQYDAQQVQNVSNAIFWTLLGLIGGIIILFLLYKLYQRMTYNYSVTVIEKLGRGELQYVTLAKQISDDDQNIMIHYLGVGHSPKWAEFSDYLRTVKTKMFGFLPTSVKGFTVYKIGEKIIPINVKSNPGLEPINYDMFNYMQWRVRANTAKYEKTDQLRQLLPIIGLGLVVVAFILGSMFWGKHVENIAGKMLAVAGEQAQNILEKSGSVQVIPGN